MADYRLYLLDENGKIVSADWLDAKSDDEAIIIVRARKFDHACEIWERQRQVAEVPASATQPYSDVDGSNGALTAES